MKPRFSKPELLGEHHLTDQFSCGASALDTFLQKHAFQNQRNSSARTFVTTPIGSQTVVGYYSLSAGSVNYTDAPTRVKKGLAKHPVPVIILARLAVHSDYHGQGLGASLLMDAFARFLTAQESIAARALLAHAKSESAKNFYLKWGFNASEAHPLHCYILTKDIHASLARS